MSQFTRLSLFALSMAVLTLEVLSQEGESTTAAPPIQLIAFANYSQPCKVITLPFTFCNTYQGTVACINNKCACNMPATDVEWIEEWNLCVGKVGSLCFVEANSIGRKVCGENQDCFPDKGDYEHNVGTCKCLHGYKENTEAKCEEDPDVPANERSTARPTTTKAPRVTGESTRASTTTEAGGDGDGNKNTSRNITSSGLVVMSLLYILSKISMF